MRLLLLASRLLLMRLLLLASRLSVSELSSYDAINVHATPIRAHATTHHAQQM
jgi:hypothetical protein